MTKGLSPIIIGIWIICGLVGAALYLIKQRDDLHDFSQPYIAVVCAFGALLGPLGLAIGCWTLASKKSSQK